MASKSFDEELFESIALTTALEDTLTIAESRPWKSKDARAIPANPMEADIVNSPESFSSLRIGDDYKSESDASSDFDPRPIHSKLLSPYAWSIVLGELCVMIFVFGFIIVTSLRQISLPPRIAEWAIQSPKMMAFCITAISTSLSVLCSFGFSKAVLLYTTAALTWSPTSLFELSAVIDVSRASFVFRKSHLLISLMTLVSFILLKSMTASFVTLLTPTPILVRHRISGQQINLSRAEFGKMLHDDIGWDTTERLKVRTLFGYTAVSSGMSAASSHIGYPSLFKFNGAAYSVPTGGILAVGPMGAGTHDSRNFGRLGGDEVGGEMKKLYQVYGTKDEVPFSSSTTYTTHQMGLRGGVSCKAIGSSGIESSRARIQLKLFKHWRSPSPRHQRFSDWVWSGACPNGDPIELPTTTSRYIPGLRNKTVEIMGQAVAEVCFDQDLNGTESPGNHVLILAGSGNRYEFLRPTVCEIRPTIGIYEVNYNSSSVMINQETFFPTHNMTNDTQILSKYLAMLTSSMVSSSQTLWANTFGDDIYSLYSDARDRVEEDELNTILDHYFNGVVEFGTTSFRAHFSTVRKLADQSLPNNISSEYNGTWIISTMGWDAKSRLLGPTFLSMVPIILVSFFSISAVLIGSYKRLISLPLHLNEPIQFDPNDMTQIIRVACAGNLSDRFSQVSVLNQVGKRCCSSSSTEKDYDKVCVQLNYDDDGLGKLIWVEPQ